MSDTSTATIASFHLIRYDTVGAMRHMAFDRPLLRGTGGLRFWRLLGTGRGPSMSLGADLRRWALFAVWRGEPDLDDFLRRSPIAARWRDEARECWQVRLRPLSARGTWGGTAPFTAPFTAPLTAAVPPVRHAGPVAVLTRASIRARSLAAFYRSVPAVDRTLREQDGLLASVGIGEWPLARQATFSLWRDARAVRDFAYRTADHRTVITRVRAHDWYGEELFARFTPYAAQGTWNGVDPLGQHAGG
ncbi:spheroidene monooxygenase [Nonomuraea sp. NPDC048916]|uniref:spheroidene monooxygenase n=1 Tax=Nonomuraea sp. NPDC048916 TaxID=3154232 RepID=UPI0033C543B3